MCVGLTQVLEGAWRTFALFPGLRRQRDSAVTQFIVGLGGPSVLFTIHPLNPSSVIRPVLTPVPQWDRLTFESASLLTAPQDLVHS